MAVGSYAFTISKIIAGNPGAPYALIIKDGTKGLEDKNGITAANILDVFKTDVASLAGVGEVVAQISGTVVIAPTF